MVPYATCAVFSTRQMTATIEQTIEIDVPIETAYNQWTQCPSAPGAAGTSAQAGGGRDRSASAAAVAGRARTGGPDASAQNLTPAALRRCWLCEVPLFGAGRPSMR